MNYEPDILPVKHFKLSMRKRFASVMLIQICNEALFTTNSMMSFGNFRCFALMFKVQIQTQIISQH
jgi:hypothetical protein